MPNVHDSTEDYYRWLREGILSGVTIRRRDRATHFMKTLLEGQYLSRILTRPGDLRPDLPTPDPGPLRTADILIEQQSLQQAFLFEQVVSALKDSPYPQPNIPAIQELRQSQEHIQLVDKLIESFEEGIKYLKNERAAFKKALNNKKNR